MSDHDESTCQHCGGTLELIPYRDASGCGTAIIELWRCPDCRTSCFGDIMGYDTCDLPQSDPHKE